MPRGRRPCSASRRSYEVEAPRFPKETDDCILCGLCVRVCRERMGVGAADFVGRGAEMRVDTPYERKSEACITCGACTFVCPTGSKRLDKVFPHKLAPRPSASSTWACGRDPRSTSRSRRRCPTCRSSTGRTASTSRTARCGTCAEVCPPKAIDYEQKDEMVRVETGAVILAPGLLPLRPRREARATPTAWRRTCSRASSSSGSSPRAARAWATWCGPRTGRCRSGSPSCSAWARATRRTTWCSSVCCMYSLKEAIIAKEHEHDVECTLFYMDIRAHGKGFDAYYERAKEMGIRFVRCRPSRIDELESKSLRVGFVPEDDGAERQPRTAPRTSTWWCSRAASSRPPRREALAAKFGIDARREPVRRLAGVQPRCVEPGRACSSRARSPSPRTSPRPWSRRPAPRPRR